MAVDGGRSVIGALLAVLTFAAVLLASGAAFSVIAFSVPAPRAGAQDASAAPAGSATGAQTPETTETSPPSPPSSVVPGTTAPPTTVAPAPVTTQAVAPEPTAPASPPAEEAVVENTTVRAEAPEKEEPATSTSAESTTSSSSTTSTVRRAPAPTTQAPTSTIAGPAASGGGTVGSTRDGAGSEDDSQQVVRLVIALLVVVALLIAGLSWRYWRYTDPRRGYAPSRARLPGPAVPGGAATSPDGDGNGRAPVAAPATAVPASVFDGYELYGAGQTTLAGDLDPTDPGPGARLLERQPERVGGPENASDGGRADPPDAGR